MTLYLWSSAAIAYPRHAGEYEFWRQMPEAAQVLADITGRDDFDAAVRRHAALDLLLVLVTVSADGKGQRPWPAREQELHRQYTQALPHLMEIGRADNRADELWSRTRQLQGDPAFLRSVVARYFSGPALREIEPFVSAFQARAQRWEAQSAAEAARAAAAAPPVDLVAVLAAQAVPALPLATGLFALLLLLGIVGELKGFRLGGETHSKLIAGFRRYDLGSVTGIVQSPSTVRETRTLVTGNAEYIGTRSETTVHVDFFIAHPDGEMAIQLVDVNLPLRHGHHLSAVWATRRRRSWSPFIMFRNHTTNQRTYIDHELRRILRPRLWPLLPMLLLVWTAGFSDILTRYALVQQPEIDAVALGSLNITLGATAGWLVAASLITRLRIRRFRRKESLRVSEALDTTASALAGSAEGLVTRA